PRSTTATQNSGTSARGAGGPSPSVPPRRSSFSVWRSARGSSSSASPLRSWRSSAGPMSTTAATSPAERSVRPAERADADVVFTLLAQVGKPYSPDRAVFDVAFGEVIDSDDHLLYVVESAGIIFGYALTTIVRLLHTNGYSAQLQELVVDTSARSAGAGSHLVSAVERELTARGVKQLTVAIVRGAASFYDRLGYRSTADYLKKDLV